MRIHSNGLLLRTTNNKVVMKLKDGSSQEWLFVKYPDKQVLIAEIIDFSYQQAHNHEKGKFNIVTFGIALTKYFIKFDEHLLTRIAPFAESNPVDEFGWLKKISFVPYSKLVSSFSPEKLKDLNELARFFIRNPFN